MKHYVSNKRETPRMFKSDFMELFSRVHWTVPLWIFIPVISALLYFGYSSYQKSPAHSAVLAVLGIFIWTLAEYMLHRFIFHFQPKSAWGKNMHWMFHGVHHDYPSDPLRLVMVPSVSIPLASLFFVLFMGLLGTGNAMPFTAGFLTGYLFYDMTHYAVHHFPIKSKVFGRLREMHMRHHYQDPDNGFGVSTPLWDHVFGTTLKRSRSTVTSK